MSKDAGIMWSISFPYPKPEKKPKVKLTLSNLSGSPQDHLPHFSLSPSAPCKLITLHSHWRITQSNSHSLRTGGRTRTGAGDGLDVFAGTNEAGSECECGNPDFRHASQAPSRLLLLLSRSTKNVVPNIDILSRDEKREREREEAALTVSERVCEYVSEPRSSKEACVTAFSACRI